MLERELKLHASTRFKLPDLDGVHGSVVSIDVGRERLQTSYYDTRDFRLTRWGAALRYRKGQGWTVKLPRDGRGSLLEREERGFAGPPLQPPQPALDLLTAYLRGAPVEEVARLKSARTLAKLHDRHGETLAGVALDSVSVFDGRAAAARFREVEIELGPSAPDDLLEAVHTRLAAAGAGAPDPTPKIARALGERAQRPAEVAIDELPPTASAGDVVRRALAEAAIRLLRHDACVRLDADPEEVHQARVAVRRLRSYLRTFMPIMDIDWASALRADLDRLADDFGAVRDADVRLERLRAGTAKLKTSDRVAARRIQAIAQAQRDEAMRHLTLTIAGKPYIELLGRVVEAATAPALAPIAAESALATLPPLVASLWRNARNRIDQFGEHPTAAMLHKLRIRAKRCRYAAEALAPIIGKRARAFAKAAAGLQDVLGEHHDAVVAQEWLRRDVPPGKLSFAAGQLSALELGAETDAYGSWREAWRVLDRKKLRTWL